MTLPNPHAEQRDWIADLLTERAAFLRTPGGRVNAQWHEADAEMVAGELDRQAKLIRALPAKAPSHAS